MSSQRAARHSERTAAARHVDRSAVSAFIPVIAMVPFALAALAVFWLPLRWTTGLAFWWVIAAFCAAGALLFVRQVQILVLTPLLGARPPSAAEAHVLQPVWHEVAATNGLHDTSFVMRVLPSDQLNAFACGGHLVVVTSYAVDHLTPAELRGVVAHELAHHLGLHTVAHTLTHWVSAPVILLARIGFFLENVGRAAATSFGRQSTAIALAGTLFAGIISAVSWVFTIALRASDALANLVGHTAEYDADRRVVRMGYGRELAAALRRTIAAAPGERQRGWRARLAASHPPPKLRVARIEAYARHPAR